MVNEATPEMEWERRIRTAQTCDEVVLPGADGLFGSISAMNVRWDELKVDAFGVHELFEA